MNFRFGLSKKAEDRERMPLHVVVKARAAEFRSNVSPSLVTRLMVLIVGVLVMSASLVTMQGLSVVTRPLPPY